MIVLFVPPAQAGAEDVAAGLSRTLAAGSTDKPVLAAILSAEGVPSALRATPAPAALFTYPESAARALGLAAERAEWLRRPAGVVPSVDGIDTAAAERVVTQALESAEDAWLTPEQTRALLTSYGLPLVEERLAESVEAAVEAARELGFPIVVKSGVAGAHKTETGGVALGLADEDAVRAAAERIGPPVIVQPMVEAGVELLAGIVQDPTFGPLVAFGPGGVLAELIGEAGFRIAPLTDVDAEELLSQKKTGLLVAGYRGAPPADVAAPDRSHPPALEARRRQARGGRARPESGDRQARTAASSSTRAHACGAPRREAASRPGSYAASWGREKTTRTLSPS